MSGFSSSSRQIVLVTGANKGIGKAICKEILRQIPESFVILGSRDASRGAESVKDIVKEVDGANDRIVPIELDVTSESSVNFAAEKVAAKFGKIYGIINNAGVGFGRTAEETCATNIYGPKRVCNSFIPLLESNGRIVNIASASGPMFVAKNPSTAKFFTDPDTSDEAFEETIVQMSKNIGSDGYGFSKALLNLYTLMLSKRYPNLCITSCTPGFIDTDITAGMGASGTPEQGAQCPIFCMFGPIKQGSSEPGTVSSGFYYGSDKVRSPLTRYRGPGDPPFEG